jgi:hypothetical protein
LIDTWESSQDSGLKGKHPVRKEREKKRKDEKDRKKIHILHFRPRLPKCLPNGIHDHPRLPNTDNLQSHSLPTPQ